MLIDKLNEQNYKIKLNLLKETNEKVNKIFFGDWINNVEHISKQFQTSLPFKHVKITNFLNKDYAEKVYQNFPENYHEWHQYNNPLEVKYANDNINEMNEHLKNFFYILSSDEIISIISKISGIDNLTYDPFLHGAGIHAHPRNGRLNLHLDYEKHPKLNNKERRLNIIFFLNKNWDKKWNGDNQLWDKDMKKCMVKTYPEFNSAIIFQTNDISWHGLPNKISCPDYIYRKSMAYYYISPLVSKTYTDKHGKDKSGYRTKAAFKKRPNDPDLPQLKKLYEIRPYRRIEKEDMETIWPEWNSEKY